MKRPGHTPAFTAAPLLVCGGSGCGKTLLAAVFIAGGAMQFGEPSHFTSFEETDAEPKSSVRARVLEAPGPRATRWQRERIAADDR
jgi:hypothetical protein